MFLESMRNIVMIFGAIIAMYYTFIVINRFNLDSKSNLNKFLKDQYDVSLTALNNTNSDSEEFENIKLLVEERKYKALIGVPSVTNTCARYLLSLDEKSRFINLYVDVHQEIDFCEKNNKFEYGYGLKTKWIRKLKIWLGLILYLLCALLAIYTPLLYGSKEKFREDVYEKIVVHYSEAVFWFIAIVWLIFWGYAAFRFVQYSAKVNLTETLVEQKPIFKIENLFKFFK